MGLRGTGIDYHVRHVHQGSGRHICYVRAVLEILHLSMNKGFRLKFDWDHVLLSSLLKHQTLSGNAEWHHPKVDGQRGQPEHMV